MQVVLIVVAVWAVALAIVTPAIIGALKRNREAYERLSRGRPGIARESVGDEAGE